jgi:hypothetical protein
MYFIVSLTSILKIVGLMALDNYYRISAIDALTNKAGIA